MIAVVAVVAGCGQIGGSATSAADPTAVRTSTRAQDPEASVVYLDVNNPLSAAAPDGAGGWFIGGSFTQVAGQRRVRLAHVAANGQLDPVWRPVVRGRARYPHAKSPSYSTVSALCVVGDTVYIGGWFTSINGQPRKYLAAVNARTGRLLGVSVRLGGEAVAGLAA